MMERKFIKQININKHRLSKEIGKVNEAEKSEIKMIDASRRRFRMKHKKLGFPSTSTASKVRKRIVKVNYFEKMIKKKKKTFYKISDMAMRMSTPSN